jgi:hypothetical protein
LKKCKLCDNDFNPRNGRQIYCSDRCRIKSKANRISKGSLYKNCRICDTAFTVEGKSRGTVFCSDKCRAKRGYKDKNCTICGEKFFADDRTKTCSKKCTSTYLRRNQLIKSCNVCDKVFAVPLSLDRIKHCSEACYRESRRTGKTSNCSCSNSGCENTFYKAPSLQKVHKWNFCSRECMAETYVSSGMFSGENSPTFNGLYGDRKKKYYGENWHNQRRLARERDHYQCQICEISEDEYGQELSVHHITPFVVFLDHLEANRLENLQSLCEPCHRVVHSGVNHPTKFNETYKELMIQSAL